MRIERLIPDRVEPGDLLSIRGRLFGSDPTQGLVFLGEDPVPAEYILAWEPGRIDLQVPEGAQGGEVWVLYRDWITPPSRITVLPKGSLQARILAFGDSITWGSGGPWGSYELLLEALLDEAGYTCAVINAGVPGETTAEGLQRMPTVLQRWDKTDVLLLLEGTNDVSDRNQGDLQESLQNLQDMIRLARDMHGLRCVVGTPPPRAQPDGDLAPPSTQQIVEGILALRGADSIPVVDFYEVFSSFAHWRRLYRDAVHPNVLGNLVMARAWYGPLVTMSLGGEGTGLP